MLEIDQIRLAVWTAWSNSHIALAENSEELDHHWKIRLPLTYCGMNIFESQFTDASLFPIRMQL